MTINWRSTLADVDAALLGASSVSAALGERVRTKLLAAGARYDVEFPPAPAPDRTTTRVESPAHVAWRAAMTDALEELQAIAAAVDGAPPAPISGDMNAARAATLERLAAAAELADAATAAVVRDALEIAARPAAFPPEPSFYVAAYYEVRLRAIERGAPSTGRIEDDLDSAVAQCASWLAIEAAL